MSASALEQTFSLYWQTHYPDAPQPRREYLFHPQMDYRFDFAWRDHLVALEIQGGAFTGGKHGRGNGLTSDFKKNNAAIALGWRIIYASSPMLRGVAITELGEIIADLVWTPFSIADLDRSRWTAVIRNLKPKDSEMMRGICVQRVSAGKYTVEKNGLNRVFTKKKLKLHELQSGVLDYILGDQP